MARIDRLRPLPKGREFTIGIGHLVREADLVPSLACVRALYGLIAIVVEAPIEMEAVARLPIALTQRIGKATVDATTSVDADQIPLAASCQDGLECALWIGQCVVRNGLGRLHLGVVEQVRIFRQHRPRLTQPLEHGGKAYAVFS